ncbi:MAG: ATP12 family chaperone protein, partial [Bacteroidota bacterium]|nr:ATP12 family protein [Kiloniellaceae bacterium]
MQQKIKRFYKSATAAPEESGGYAVLLDGRPVRTPAKAPLTLPSAALAAAIAEEWQGQGVEVDPRAMPLNALACTAIDVVAPARAQIVADLMGFAGHDLLCYWTDETGELLRRQQQDWQPLLDWAARDLDAPLHKTCGIASQAQPAASLAALERAVAAHDDLALTALAAAAKAAGSLVIALALARRRLDAAEAFRLSQLDELYQAERWGEDAEAARRREALR